MEKQVKYWKQKTKPIRHIIYKLLLINVLGLPHTFDGYSLNTLFAYEKSYTDNIMDYVDDDFQKITKHKNKSLYHWQWQIPNSKIR